MIHFGGNVNVGHQSICFVELKCGEKNSVTVLPNYVPEVQMIHFLGGMDVRVQIFLWIHMLVTDIFLE